MTKLIVNEKELKQRCIPNLEYAVTNINYALEKASGLDVPSSFRYASKLKELTEDVILIRNNLNSIRNWISQSNIFMDNTLKEIDDELNLIKNIEIKKRKSAIK